jgi:hypothetical protein
MQETHQITDTLLMVRPANFGFNEETAASNAFQINDQSLSNPEIQAKALVEFDALVGKLRDAGIQVLVVEDTADPFTPDAIFPNNWVTFHEDGTVMTYPMCATKRRLERREDILELINKKYSITQRYELEAYEADNMFLEGTGSMILDRENKIAYACLSPRTDLTVLDEFCEIRGYEPLTFLAVDQQGLEIYHTNVMMALGATFVVIALDTVQNQEEKERLEEKFAETGKEIILISIKQMLSFAGNMLQVGNAEGKTFLVMSEQAFQSLTPTQIAQIEKHTTIIHSDIPTIEKYGGGSVRCMMAEVFHA